MTPQEALDWSRQADRMRAQELGQWYQVVHADKLKGGAHRVSVMLRKLNGEIDAERAQNPPCPAQQETVREDGTVVGALGYEARGNHCPFTRGMPEGEGRDHHGLPHCFRCKELWRSNRAVWEDVIYEQGRSLV